MAFATDLYFKTLYNFTAFIYAIAQCLLPLVCTTVLTLLDSFSFLELGSTERSTLDELQLLWLEQVLSAHAEGPPGLERHREKGSSREQEFSSDVIVFKVRTVFLHERQMV